MLGREAVLDGDGDDAGRVAARDRDVSCGTVGRRAKLDEEAAAMEEDDYRELLFRSGSGLVGRKRRTDMPVSEPRDHVFDDAGNRVEAGGRTPGDRGGSICCSGEHVVVIAVEHYLVGAGIHHESRADLKV
ncbi:hypothetical protein ZWY2020_038441 [Hordeum vulgare]|nr:hypothetical protein ZWY2020_038441 [Hordeum vulgare]